MRIADSWNLNQGSSVLKRNIREWIKAEWSRVECTEVKWTGMNW